ncbi:MAG: hypothetical protein ACXQTR_01795 [Candidatus Methanospirareceae archaeon]
MFTNRYISQNNRWGVVLKDLTNERGERGDGVYEGRLVSLGRASGMDVFRFIPDKGKYVVVVRSDAEAITGATAIVTKNLQGGDSVTVFTVAEGGIIKTYGYRHRSSSYKGLRDGKLVSVPVEILLDLGVIEPVEDSIIDIPEAPTSGANWELVKEEE